MHIFPPVRHPLTLICHLPPPGPCRRGFLHRGRPLAVPRHPPRDPSACGNRVPVPHADHADPSLGTHFFVEMEFEPGFSGAHCSIFRWDPNLDFSQPPTWPLHTILYCIYPIVLYFCIGIVGSWGPGGILQTWTLPDFDSRAFSPYFYHYPQSSDRFAYFIYLLCGECGDGKFMCRCVICSWIFYTRGRIFSHRILGIRFEFSLFYYIHNTVL